MSVPSSPDHTETSQPSDLMVGCGCRNAKDVITFIIDRNIQYADLAWADEMGLWQTGVVPTSELSLTSLQEGIPFRDGKYLVPDPLSAKIAPLSNPNVILLTCTDVFRGPTKPLKAKQLNPMWIEMVSKKVLENTDSKRSSSESIQEELQYASQYSNVPYPANQYSSPYPTSQFAYVPQYSRVPSPPYQSPPQQQYAPKEYYFSHEQPALQYAKEQPQPTRKDAIEQAAKDCFIEWRIKDSRSPSPNPSSPVYESPNGSPPTVPGSPLMYSTPGSAPGSPPSPVPLGQMIPFFEKQEQKSKKGVHVPPLLRPRQVHPTKAHKLGINKPIKKRRNTEHLYCRHCGTTETPEWRRGPDGRKSLCNACGLYFSKMVKRENLVQAQTKKCAIGDLLNPSCV